MLLAAQARMTLTALLDAGFAGAPVAAVRVDFDMTVIYAAVVFLALACVLEPLLFKPILRIFALREKRTEGARTEAREMQERAVELIREFDRELGRMRRTATEEREKIRIETMRVEAQILEEARESTTRIIDEGRRQVESTVVALRREMDAQTPQLARQIASAVLGREVR